MRDLLKRVRSLGLNARVELEDEALTIHVSRQRSENNTDRRIWSETFEDACVLHAWLKGYERAKKDQNMAESDN